MKRTSSTKLLMILSLAVTCALWAGGSEARGQEGAGAATSPDAVIGETIQVPVGQSVVVKVPVAAGDITPPDPKIADVKVLTPHQLLVQGKGIGATDVIVKGQDNRVWKARVEVTIDRAALKAELGKLFPRTRLEIRQLGANVVLTGQLSKAEEAEQIHRYMDAVGLKFLDLTTLPGVPQVQLKVTVAEANRTALRSLGFNVAVGGSSAFGGVNIGNNTITQVPLSSQPPTVDKPLQIPLSTTLFGGVPGSDLTIFIDALSDNQYVRVLAEPTLTALSGQEASFLAGGEIPIPVPQSGGGVGNTTTITIEYKEFGVRLRFRPTVQGDGIIRLHVAPEVSDLDFTNGLRIPGTGFSSVVPALKTRRAETTLELGSGQTFAMAGLLNRAVDADTSRVPGLGDAPIIGALFRSVRYKAQDTEMLVLVTASLVEPQSGVGPYPVPGITHVAPNDWELYALGAIEGTSPVKRPPTVIGPAGVSLNRLKGPGAWASYDPPAPVTKKPEAVVDEECK